MPSVPSAVGLSTRDDHVHGIKQDEFAACDREGLRHCKWALLAHQFTVSSTRAVVRLASSRCRRFALRAWQQVPQSHLVWPTTRSEEDRRFRTSRR
jgi:hypothetical protein